MAVVAATAMLFVVGSCGDDDDAEPFPTTPSSSTPTSTGGDVEHPDSAYDLAIELDTTVAWHGSGGTHVLIGGDGRVYEQDAEVEPGGWRSAAHVGNASASAPAPPPPQGYTVAELTDEGMQRVYQRAGELGLLTIPVPDYDASTTTDQGTASLTIATGGAEIEHRLYDPQSPDDEYTDERARLATFLDEVSNIESLVGDDNIGDRQPYVPEQWTVSTEYAYGTAESPPDWPFEKPPREGCLALPSDTERDTATGLYSGRSGSDEEGGNAVWQVEPAFPWDQADC